MKQLSRKPHPTPLTEAFHTMKKLLKAVIINIQQRTSGDSLQIYLRRLLLKKRGRNNDNITRTEEIGGDFVIVVVVHKRPHNALFQQIVFPSYLAFLQQQFILLKQHRVMYLPNLF